VTDLFRALGAACEPPEAAHGPLAAALGLPPPPDQSAYTACFLFQLYPFASVYLGAEGMLGGEARDRVAGFWRALGLVPPPEPDHLPALLGLYAELADNESAERDALRRSALRDARRALLWEHLVSWLPPYLDRVTEIAHPHYKAWAALLREALVDEIASLGALPRLPLHFREAPPPPRADAIASLDDLLSAVLAPARSGMIIVRADLKRAGQELGFGTRAGERRFMLKGLMEANPKGTLRWLEVEARRATARHGAAETSSVSAYWAERAEASALCLASLADGLS
jgi:TorA maturation chaperone TorD